MKRRLLSILCVLALCLGLLPVTALAVDPAENVAYIYYEWDDIAQTLSGPKTDTAAATVVTENDYETGWGGDDGGEYWYAVTQDITIGTADKPQRVTVTGDVHLILTDGCTLTVTGGIQVAEDDSLTIYGQENDTGTLGATAGTGEAGIGGGRYGAGGNINIYGGTVTATGGGWGAGIGGGRKGAGGTIEIYGGNVKANSVSGAGIGGGLNGGGGEITISGGTITATGQGGGAGIGGGGGTSGLGDAGSFSTGDNGSAVIFASGSSAIQDTEDLADPWQGVIFLGNSGAVYGNRVTPTEDFTIPSGKALTIDSGKTLIIPEGVILANKGTITNNGEIIVYGTLEGSGSIEGSGTFPVTGVTLDKTSLTLTVGGTGTLTAAVQPSSASNKTLTWSSDNEAIATVDDSGKVTAVGAGTAVITATAADGSGKSASCTVTVTEPYVPPVPLRRTTATPPTPSPGPERWRGAGSP